MKPLIFYVDDEPHNLVVFEAACPDDWDVKTFQHPMAALTRLDEEKPSVIVSDQRMPGMTGVQFLEVARKLHPDTVRIIVTGYSDEDLVVESVRKAQIFDYIKKPWDVDDLVASIARALELNRATSEKRLLQEQLQKRESELQDTNTKLLHAITDLELAQKKEVELRSELECWVPPFVLWALKDSSKISESRRDVVGIAIDIIGSGKLHNIQHGERPIRLSVIQNFSEAVLRHGGWRESHSGDSAYGHFGLINDNTMGSPAECALAAAREFRASLRSITSVNGTSIECGIALHIARECPVHIHTVHLNTSRGLVTQKSFDTSCADVDLLHRMEKLVHSLPGSNIIMSADFLSCLKGQPNNAVKIGAHQFKGQPAAVELWLIPGDQVTPADLERCRALAVDVQLEMHATVQKKAA